VEMNTAEAGSSARIRAARWPDRRPWPVQRLDGRDDRADRQRTKRSWLADRGAVEALARPRGYSVARLNRASVCDSRAHHAQDIRVSTEAAVPPSTNGPIVAARRCGEVLRTSSPAGSRADNSSRLLSERRTQAPRSDSPTHRPPPGGGFQQDGETTSAFLGVGRLRAMSRRWATNPRVRSEDRLDLAE
jgi:hypothetical protein